MAKVSYVINIYNQEKYIEKLVNSLRNIKGAFRKEFIFINDCSTDDSLDYVKYHSQDLPNTTIINRGKKAVAGISEGIFIAQGEYVQFVDGEDVISENATVNLLDSLYKCGHRVAFGDFRDYEQKFDISDNVAISAKVIKFPIKTLLKTKQDPMRKIGVSSSIIERDLIEEISNNGKEITHGQNYSLVLRCASKSDFVYYPEVISYTQNNSASNSFSHKEMFSALKAIEDLIDFAPCAAEKHKKEIYKFLILSEWELSKKKIAFLPIYFKSFLNVMNLDLSKIRNLTEKIISKYF